MSSVTTQVRDVIRQRLLALGSQTAANIGAVCNPDEVRNPANRAQEPMLTAVIWTLPGRMLAMQGAAVKWEQTFTVDIAVPWKAGTEERCDDIRLELATALSGAYQALPVKKNEVTELDVGYPAEGSSYALVSATVVLEYIETIKS
jgi:hypothetical protein